MLASNGRRPRNELHIDMNEPMQPVEGKRIRKPRIIEVAAESEMLVSLVALPGALHDFETVQYTYQSRESKRLSSSSTLLMRTH